MRALRFLIAYLAALSLLLTPAFGQVAPDYSKTRGGKVATLLCASAVAVSVTGTTSETALATCTVPAGAMGPNGGLLIRSSWTVTNSANNKVLRTRLGGLAGTAYMQITLSASATLSDERRIRNRGVANSQVGATGVSSAAFGSNTVALPTSAIDTSAAVDLVLTGALASAAETITLENYEVWRLP